MKIRPRPTTAPVPLPGFSAWQATGGGLRLPLSAYWGAEGTLVEEAWVRPAFVRAVEAWIAESLDLKPVPETGGFCFGQVQAAGDRYRVSLDRFVPARDPAFCSPDRLDFGVEALRDLDAAWDEAGPLDLVAWLHTHPGHTPYLSGMDLRIHEGFFRHPYQLAIVVDPLTPDWDTGFFSRRPSGRMNNRGPGLRWVPWRTQLGHLAG